MDDSLAPLTELERAFLEALQARGVRFLVVGMSAALIQGVRGATEDIDLWFERLSDPAIAESARHVGGFVVTRTQPPLLGGVGDRFDVVTTMDGLPSFDDEYAGSVDVDLGVHVKVLPLRRILVSKRAANREKDRLPIEQIERTLRVLDSLSDDESEA